MKNPIQPQLGILEIAPYQSGSAKIEGMTDVIKLSANENPYGPGAKARDAFLRSAHQLHRYPGTDHASLRAAISEMLGLDADRIICGVGSDEVLQFVAQAYAGPRTEVIVTEHGFSMYPILAHAVGAKPVEVKERDRMVDIDAILEACTDRTRIVFLTNPGNPTGTLLPDAEVARLADGLPPRALLVLDGAYAEFADDFDGGAALVEARQNVIMTRTFSKIHGLGGLRIGWGYGPKEVVGVLNRIRQPFNLSETQLSTAEAAIRDTEHKEHCRSENARLRSWLAKALAEVGVPSDPSSTNFILARFADQIEAEACDDYLKSQGLIVRRVAGYKLPNCLRITIGDESSCRRVAHAVAAFRESRT